MILLAQVIYIIGDFTNLALARQWNKAIGIPTILGYLVATVVSVLDNGFNQFGALIFFGKVVPQGVESTTVGILFHSISVNNFTLRPMMGLYYNQHYFNVTREDMSNYWRLRATSLFCDFLPFLFMF